MNSWYNSTTKGRGGVGKKWGGNIRKVLGPLFLQHIIPKDRLKLCLGQRCPPGHPGPQPWSSTPLTPQLQTEATGHTDSKGRIEPTTHPLSRTTRDTMIGMIRVATSQHHQAPAQLQEPPAIPEGSQLNQQQLLGLRLSPQGVWIRSGGPGPALMLLFACYV